MCPLRVILIFLSATLAGFFVLRNLRTPGQPEEEEEKTQGEAREKITLSRKVGCAICDGFWTCVDMASGRYLWRNLVEKKC